MGSLLNSLTTVADSMRATQQAIELAGNNITNARTPNFAKQRLDLQARRFEVNHGLSGGVESDGLINGRKGFLEQAVHEQGHRHGRLAQQTSDLERLEPLFDVTNGSGVGGSIDRLFQSFSAWSVSPNDTSSREAVLAKAEDLAQSFRFTASSLSTATVEARTGLTETVDAINRIGAELQKFNVELQGDARSLEDPGLESRAFQLLEELSGLVDFDTLRAEDGTITVSLGGQTPLTIGRSFFPISIDVSGSRSILRNAQGADVTGQVQQGKLRAQLDQQNSFLPGLTADFNRLAATVADSVNAQLAGGLDASGTAPVTDLFRYDGSTGAAATLTVNPIGTSELAAASSGAPGGNGNALALADLSRARLIDGQAPGQFYGGLAGKVGRALANARSDENTQQLLLAQARNIRATETEVNIDEEASNLVAFQRQYEANAELIRILNSLTETTINIIR